MDRAVRPSPIGAARERHALIDVAHRTGVDVHRSSGSVTVRCPLPTHGHFDRSPSMRLHLDDGIWHCFGCGQMGDVVEWVQQTEGLGWRQAIEVLDSGLPLTNAWHSHTWNAYVAAPRSRHSERLGDLEYPELDRTSPEWIYAALALAWEYSASGALHAKGASYLAERGIDVTLLEGHNCRLEVGHTPTRPDGLVTRLRHHGFSDDELVDAGLAQRRYESAAVTDFYRERVLIPVRDSKDRVCGLIGRNRGDDRFPKYKNPPRTHAYDKS
ncbi:MAG: CHC2 zinc finger domain-containing protein, partial [Acidimicrobiales bacterium]